MQQNLFSNNEELKLKQNASVNVVFSKFSKNTSKEKVDFQKAIEKNNQLKKKVEYVKNIEIHALDLSHQILGDIEDQYINQLLEEVIQLDKCFQNRLFKFTKKRKEKLAEIIVEKAGSLFNEYECEEAEQYINKHLPELEEEEEAMMTEQISLMFEEMFGIKMESEDFVNGQPNFEKMNEKYGDKITNKLLGNEQFEREEGMPKRKKTKKQLEKEEKENAEEKLLNTDIQSIFKELAKKLHPDTELDEELKLEKQDLMQKLVNARDENDIFELLKMRLSILADNDSMNIFDAASMKRLTKMIREKNKNLESQIYHIQINSPVLSKIGVIIMDESKMKLHIKKAIEQQKEDTIHEMSLIKKSISSWSSSNQNLNIAIDQYELENDPFDNIFDF